ncbi:MAG: sulfatase-like hydrolase/transferase [Bacteroidota bacterium]
MKISWIFLLAVSFILPFMLFFTAPLSFYYGNINDIEFSLREVIFPLTGLFLAVSLIFYLLLYFLWSRPKSFNIMAGFLVGFAVAIWVQSQLFAWKFGLLDGQDIDWTQWKIHMWIEAVVWLIVLASMILIFFRGKEKLKKIVLQALFLLGFLSIAISFISAPSKIKKIYVQNDIDNVFFFHEKNNILVILLDGFQSDYFDLIRKEYPKEVSFLDGFTFYKNTMSHYPTTAPSIPAIVSGRLYKNQEIFDDFFRDSVSNCDLQQYYQKLGYNSRILGVYPRYLMIKDIFTNFSFTIVSPVIKFLDYGIFRCSPTIFKKNIYNNGAWFLSFWKKQGYPPVEYGRDIRFAELFEKQATIKTDNKVGTFKFIHFFTPHFPVCMDENLHYDPSLSGVDGYIKQTRGALVLAQRILNKLKDLNLYNNSEIVIMADHGTLAMPPISPVIGRVPKNIRSSALALLLYKPPPGKRRVGSK